MKNFLVSLINSLLLLLIPILKRRSLNTAVWSWNALLPHNNALFEHGILFYMVVSVRKYAEQWLSLMVLFVYFTVLKSMFLSISLPVKWYSGTSLKWTLMGQKFLSPLERSPRWRGLNWKVPKFNDGCFTLDLLSHGLLLPFIWLWECRMVKKK